MDYCLINSKENKLFKNLKKLKTKKTRDKEQLFIAEGRKFLDFSVKPKYIVIDEDKSENYANLNIDCKRYIFSNYLFKEITTQENSQGIILIYDYLDFNSDNLSNHIIVLDQVQDPGNLGTIIRTADAAGYKDIILIKGTVDIYNDKVVRSSMGSLFNMNFIYMDYNEAISLLQDKQYNLIATALHNDSIDYTEMKLKDKNALIFGNEGNGISDELINISNQKVIIPILGTAESLNVAIAAGIILYKSIEV